jgi:three-Cys-motif partner protein
MTSPTQDFFDAPREHSKVKAQIVFKYVQSWARVLSDFQRKSGRSPEVAYVDLFSGPGIYGDGTPSTPMLVLKAAVEDPKLGSALRTYFNDLSEKNVAALGEAIGELPGRETLKYEPQRFNEEATLSLIQAMRVPASVPRLYFLDQFGYKHVALTMIQKLMIGWAECIFFFNYRRAIAAIDNPAMTQNVHHLFGGIESLGALKEGLARARGASSREEIVMAHLIKALQGAGVKYIQQFSFKVEDGQRSTHHLIFLSNHQKGYTIMKGIMAGEGTQSREGLPYLCFIQRQTPQTGDLFPIDWVAELGTELCREFAGRTMTLHQIFLAHSHGKNFLPAHYKEALLRLESEDKVTTHPQADRRPTVKGARTMAVLTQVTFPGGQK